MDNSTMANKTSHNDLELKISLLVDLVDLGELPSAGCRIKGLLR
jgi:hypothetical protein